MKYYRNRVNPILTVVLIIYMFILVGWSAFVEVKASEITMEAEEITLSAEEMKYVREREPLVVAIMPEMFPFESYEYETGEPEGIMIDYLEHIAENTGLTFTYEPVETISELKYKLKNGTIDLVTSVSNSDYSHIEYNLTLTDPCFVSKMSVLVSDKIKVEKDVDNIMKTLDKSLIAAVTDRYAYPELLTKYNGFEKIRYYSSYEECLDAIQMGEADFTLIPELCAYNLLEHEYYRDLKMYDYSSKDFEYCIGVNNSCNSIVTIILNKGIGMITEEEHQQIKMYNIMKSDTEFNFRDVLFKYKEYAWIIVVLSMIIIYFLIMKKIADSSGRKDKTIIGRIQMYSAVINVDESLGISDTIISRVSHEIRTPLNIIMNMAELASDNTNSSEQRADYLKKLMSAGKYLIGVVNNILDIKKIKNSGFVIKEDKIFLDEVIEEVNTILEPQIAEKNIKFSCKRINLTDEYIVTDKLCLEQVLINILSNAIKYTKEGGRVDYVIKCTYKTGSKIGIEIEIEDSGIGISPEFLPHIFKPFMREERYENKYEGTGLGLAIVKEIVDLMGGRIKVKSIPMIGTKFSLSFVFDRVKESVTESNNNVKAYIDLFKGLNVLVADDSPINLEIMTELLIRYGVNVHGVSDGRVCYEKYMESSEGYYDFIFMDVRMPEVDGVTATKMIRESGRGDSQKVIIIAMTADGSSEDIERSLAAGINIHLTKPVDSRILYKLMSDHMADFEI